MATEQETTPPKTWNRRDLACYPLCGLSWKPEDCEESLNQVFEHVRRDALEAISWYVRARRPKRHVATSARFLAVALLGVAALLPLLEGILITQVQPIWISLAIATAAGAIGLDRALGSSSGWIRCIKTELQLRDALEHFELEWETTRANLRGTCPSPEQTTQMLKTAKDFAAQINIIVQEETNAWVEEFQSTINQIDEKLRSRAEARARNDRVRSELAKHDGVNRPANQPAQLVPAGYRPHEWNEDSEEGLL